MHNDMQRRRSTWILGRLCFNIRILASCSPCEASTVKTVRRTWFYVFGGEGIYLIDPESKSVVSTIAADGVCTKSKFSMFNCSFGGAVVVENELVFVSDSPGNRVHVIDIAKNKIIETIPTEVYPFGLNYLPWLDEVWVHAWGQSTFDVIDTAGRLEKTHKAIKAHVQPGWTHGYLYADQKLKDGKVGYVTHLFNPGLHQLDLTSKSYKDFVNMSSYSCTGTFHFVYSTVNKHAFFECFGSDEVIELDVSSDKVVRRWNFTGVPYISPDGRYVVSLYKKVNEGLNVVLESKVFVLFIADKDSSPTLQSMMNIPGGVSDLVFRQKANQPSSFFVFISLIYSARIAVLDLDSSKLSYIDGVGSVFSRPGMHAVNRPIVDGDGWIVSPATANNSVAIINAETRQLHGLVSGIVGGKRFAVVYSIESRHYHDSSGRIQSPSVISFSVLLFAVFIAV